MLVTTARIDGKLHGFTFSTLERIGGTPCVLLGLMSVKRTLQARPGAARPDGRGLPPGADGVPRRGRRRRLPVRQRRRPRGLQGARRHHPPPRHHAPSARSGPGAGAWPSASASRPSTTSRRSSSRRTARPASSTTSAEARDDRPAPSPSCSPTVAGRQGRLADRLRLDDGRGPRQARRADRTERAATCPSSPRSSARRRMTRAFDDRPGRRPSVLDELVDLGVAGAERRQDPGLAPRGARGRRDGALLGHHAAADAA